MMEEEEEERMKGLARVVAFASTMHRFRKKPSPSATPTNSPPPTSTPLIAKHIKQELATSRPRSKDGRTLAASSNAIASPSRDPTDNTPDKPGSTTESVWKTAYGVARMAVEIANASSDMFLPLKAVVGALSVLIKNYDVGPLWASPPVN